MNRPALEEDVARALEAFPPDGAGRVTVHHLTRKERQVLQLIGAGWSNEEIGAALYISLLTVRTHVKHIHEKCGVPGRARLAVVASKIERATA